MLGEIGARQVKLGNKGLIRAIKRAGELRDGSAQKDRERAVASVAAAQRILKRVTSPSDFLDREQAAALVDFLGEKP